MSPKSFFQLTGLSTLATLAACVFLLWTVDPRYASAVDFFLLYVSAFITVVGISAMAGVLVRVHLRPEIILFRHIVISFRQAVWISLLIVFSLALLAKMLLVWWSVVLMIFILSLIEYACQRRDHRPPTVQSAS